MQLGVPRGCLASASAARGPAEGPLWSLWPHSLPSLCPPFPSLAPLARASLISEDVLCQCAPGPTGLILVAERNPRYQSDQPQVALASAQQLPLPSGQEPLE